MLRIILVLPHTSNRIYLLQNCFSNYVYLKDMYITSKRIGNIQFTSMLRILLICTFLSFAATFTKKNFSKFGCNFPLGKANFSLIHSTHIATYSFWRVLLSSYALAVISKRFIKKTVKKKNDYWIFLILFVFTLVFFLELEARDGSIFQIIQLYIWAAVGHKLTIIGTRAQKFNLWLIS